MFQPQPKESTINTVLKLVDQLNPDELAELRCKLDSKSWGKEWRQLTKDVDEDNKDRPPLSDEEIMTEVRAARKNSG